MMRMHRTSLTQNDSSPTGASFDQIDTPDWIAASAPANGGGAPSRLGGTAVAPGHIGAAANSTVLATTTLTQVLYLQEASTASLISVSDINRGQIGDCFLLSSIGELALWHPGAITGMICTNSNGTETVTLNLAATGQLPSYFTTTFETTSVTINDTFPSNAVNNGATQDVLNGQKEIWVQVLEKAVATLEGGYGAISYGGSPVIAMEELTGQPATWMAPGSLTLQQLQAFMAAGDLIVMDTPSSGFLPYGLVNCHAYMFERLTMVGGTAMVQLGNPWGFDQPSAIPLSLLSTGIAEVDIGRFVASNVITGTPGNDTIVLSNAIINASIDLGAGSDKLFFANGTNSATVANTETIIGGSGNDTIVLSNAVINASIDLGAGSDKLTLANATNTATVSNVETLVGGSGNDTITLSTALTAAASVDLGTGSNKLTLANTGNAGTVSNVSALVGGSGNDTITLATALANASIDLGAGSDKLTLSNATNTATVSNVETLVGGSGNDTITLATALANASIDLGAGSDKLTLSNATNTATVSNVETLVGGSGNDTITLATALANASIDLGAGSDKLTLSNATNTATVSNVETLVGGSGNDTITLATALANASIDLGAGSDKLTLSNATNTATVSNVETLVGGSGNDTITLATALANASIDLGAGSDKLTLSNATNTATVSNVETLVGGSGNDTITLATALANASINLGAGSNKLTLANTGNAGTVGNVGTLTSGSGADTIVLGAAVVNGSVDLGGGNDTLVLANQTNRVTVANTETVYGGSGNDTIVLQGTVAATAIGGGGMNFITGNSAADRFVFDQNGYGNTTTVMNFNSAKGDKIALDTTGSNILTDNAYDLGGAPLALNADLADVANAASRLSTTLANGGRGAFVYEQDIGDLFYSRNGSFAGGGTLVGAITTNGATLWLFNAGSFTQV